MELLPKGWGVMADDILAGVYAHILLQLIVFYKIF
jgi:phosphatidylglycerophosphatase A